MIILYYTMILSHTIAGYPNGIQDGFRSCAATVARSIASRGADFCTEELVYVYIYIYIYVYSTLYIYIYIYIYRERERDIQITCLSSSGKDNCHEELAKIFQECSKNCLIIVLILFPRTKKLLSKKCRLKLLTALH